MLDRSQPTNLFSEHAPEADELAGAADAAVEPAASPNVDPAQAQRDRSPSTTASTPARARRRSSGGGRRGGARPKRVVAPRRPALALPVPPRLRAWARRARPFAPVALLLLILVADPAGCDRQVTPIGTPASSVPAGALAHRHASAARPRARRSAPPPATATPDPGRRCGARRACRSPRGASTRRRARRAQPEAPAPSPVSAATAIAQAPSPGGAPAAPAAAQVTPAAQATPPAVPAPASRPAAPNSGSPPPEEHDDEFGFER
jgi:hypothetical protein